jgi:hypothetical protein
MQLFDENTFLNDNIEPGLRKGTQVALLKWRTYQLRASVGKLGGALLAFLDFLQSTRAIVVRKRLRHTIACPFCQPMDPSRKFYLFIICLFFPITYKQ